nr:MAG: hypothetical protein [Caudoviricetes sp.]
MSISLVYYSNTFADWVTTTNLVVNKVNFFDTGNFVKSSGTMVINVPSAYTSTLDISGRTTFTSNVSFTAGNVQFSNTANAIFSVNTFFNRELTSNNVVKLNNVYANGNIWFGNSSVIRISSNTLVANLNSELLGGKNIAYYVDISSNASFLSNGTVPTARLATGVANSTTYLRGDNTWQQIITDTSLTVPVREFFVSTANQTSFSVTGNYTPGMIDVYYNGSKLLNGYDVDVSSGTSIILSSPASNGSIIDIVSFDSASYDDVVRKSGDSMTGALIAPSFSGNGANLTSLSVTNINASGTANANTFLTGSSVWRKLSVTDLGSGTANANTYLSGDGNWKPVISGATLTNDVSSNSVLYIGMTNSDSGTWSNAYVSNTQLYFSPNTGTLSATIFNSLSDASLKEGFVDLTDSLNIINKINPLGFTWKTSGKKSYGVIAQELEKILPELVVDNNGIKSVEYNSLIAFLIGAVKEMSERLDKLENK